MTKIKRPEGHHTITPSFAVTGAAKVIEFIEKAFGGKVVDRYDGPGGTVAHAEVMIGDSVIMLGEATPGFESQGEATSGEEALALADEVDPDLVLIDVRMPGMSGVETASRLSAAHPTATSVLVSSDDRTALPADVERCGAAAFLCKEEFGTSALTRLWALHGQGRSRPALQ